MKRLVILGAGTGGTIMANKLAEHLDPLEWHITLVDEKPEHYYQPGFLFIPFGIYDRQDVIRPKRNFLPRGVEFLLTPIEEIQPQENKVRLGNGQVLPYDILIIATGSDIHPEETEGLLDGGWRENIFDFYTLEGALALRNFLKRWQGGRLVINLVEMPIKCPVAPLEFAFLAEWWLREQGLRSKVDLTYVTPLDGAFTRPVASRMLGDFLERRGIQLVPEFNVARVDAGKNKLISWDEREVEYDLLVTIPTNMGSEVIARSGLGDDLNFVPTDPHTLQAKQYPNIFVIGDATDVPASKAGSVAHFQAEILTENILRYIEGLPLKPEFDGHANCFIETGYGKAMLIDFNYETEPLPGKYPLPGVGPFSLLQESAVNHWGKLMFRWVYWNLLLKGAELPVEATMSMAGKRVIS